MAESLGERLETILGSPQEFVNVLFSLGFCARGCRRWSRLGDFLSDSSPIFQRISPQLWSLSPVPIESVPFPVLRLAPMCATCGDQGRHTECRYMPRRHSWMPRVLKKQHDDAKAGCR